MSGNGKERRGKDDPLRGQVRMKKNRAEVRGPSKGERKEKREKRKERAKESCAVCCGTAGPRSED
jgi:hypothetical protein